MARKFLAAIIVLCVLTFAACAGVRTEPPLTAKQQASIWLGIYNAQYDDAMFVMSSPAATAAQKDIAKKKKEILTQVWPLLKIYVSAVDNNGTPTASDTAQLVELINKLTTMAGGV